MTLYDVMMDDRMDVGVYTATCEDMAHVTISL